MDDTPKSKPTLRARADKVKDFRCKNLIAVIENPDDIRNIGTIIRNVNALGVEKAYVVTGESWLPDEWADMRTKRALNAISGSAIKWSFVKKFKDTDCCMNHLDQNGFVSVVTSPHVKGRKNVVLHEHDYTPYKKLAVWFGNEGSGISKTALDRSDLCINIPMYGIIESLNLGTSSGIVLYEITKQRRAFQFNLMQKITAKKAGGKVLGWLLAIALGVFTPALVTAQRPHTGALDATVGSTTGRGGEFKDPWMVGARLAANARFGRGGGRPCQHTDGQRGSCAPASGRAHIAQVVRGWAPCWRNSMSLDSSRAMWEWSWAHVR